MAERNELVVVLVVVVVAAVVVDDYLRSDGDAN